MIGNTGSGPIFSFDQKQEDEGDTFIKPVGKSLLVEIKDGSDSIEHIHGIIESLDVKEGVTIRLNNSNQKRTVPYASTFQMARLGTYTLNTGEVVKDPDYTMVLKLPPKK
jgi:hypothetical protein